MAEKPLLAKLRDLVVTQQKSFVQPIFAVRSIR
jgi:hypothetical protein